MRIVYVDEKNSIEEPETRYPTMVDAVAALDGLFKKGLSTFGQILSNDGAVLQNAVPGNSRNTEVQETTAQPV